LQTERPGTRLAVDIRIDEANAVVLDLLRRRKPTDVPPLWHVAVLHLNGGSFDASVLAVRFDRTAGRLTTQYVAVAGESVGVDDIIRATTRGLIQRLQTSLPSLAADENGEPAARRTFAALWRFAWATLTETDSPPLVAEIPTAEVDFILTEDDPWAPMPEGVDFGAGLLDTAPAASESPALRRLRDVGEGSLSEATAHLDADAQARLATALALGPDILDEALRERLRGVLIDLTRQVSQRGIRLDLLVPSGCWLSPLSGLVGEAFPGMAMEDVTSAPERVALGLAHHQHLLAAQASLRLGRATDVVRCPLGVTRAELFGDGGMTFDVVVPVGAPLNAPDVIHRWDFTYPFEGQTLTLSCRLRSGEVVKFGDFDLAAGLPRHEDETYHGELRLSGGGKVELRVTVRGQQHGPFLLRLAVPNPEAMLLGELVEG
jgi:hypothetical protein